MKLTLEKRKADLTTENINDSDIRSIKEILGRQNKIETKYIGFSPQPNKNLYRFFKSFIGPGDEVLTIGPTNEKIGRAITACDASYFEFYEKPLFLPDSLGVIGKVTNRTKLIILGNPNRFTGVLYSQKEIEDILNISENIYVVLDESTFESGRITAIDLITKYDNLAIIRSLEKSRNNQIEYIIGGPTIIEKDDKNRFGHSYDNPDLPVILNNLKNPENRMGRLKDVRQEMLYLSIRLRMFGLGCFLNPDYSLIIDTAESEELLSLLNETGVLGLNLACFPGLEGNILVPFDLDIDVMSLINRFENLSKTKKYYKPGQSRLTIFRPSESINKILAKKNNKIILQNRLESNIVF